MASFPIIVLKFVLSFSVLRKIQNCSCQFKPIIFWKAVFNFIRVGDYKTILGVCKWLLQWDLVYRGSQKPGICNHIQGQRTLSLSAEFIKLRHEYKKDRKLIGTVYGKWFAWINESNSRLISSLEFIFRTKQRCFFFFIFLNISCDVSHCLQVFFFFLLANQQNLVLKLLVKNSII